MRVGDIKRFFILAQSDPFGTRPDLFVRYATAFANVLTWDEVRRGIAEREWLAGAVTPDVARWMDDGMLSRFEYQDAFQ